MKCNQFDARMARPSRMLALAAVGWLAASVAAADVVVLANRTAEQVRFGILPADGGDKRTYSIEPGDVRPVPVSGAVAIQFLVGARLRRYHLEANACYFFHRGARQGDSGQAPADLDLEQIGLAGAQRAPTSSTRDDADTVATGKPTPASHAAEPLRIPVKVLVDDDERAARQAWERRLRKRLSAASRVIEQHAQIAFEIAAVDTWDSDDETTDFDQSLLEFEQEVQPQPAQLVIGFTSQYSLPTGPPHLGGTRGSLKPHILIREWSLYVTEPERLELLVHELGHYLGATHSPERDSVMRPVLGDRQARLRSFRIRFDPLNTLALWLVGEELRERGISNLTEMQPVRRQRLVQVYSTLAHSLPDDPAPNVQLRLLAAQRQAAIATEPAAAPVSGDAPKSKRPRAPTKTRSSPGKSPKPKQPLAPVKPKFSEPEDASPPKPPATTTPLARSTRSVVQAICDAAQTRADRGNTAGAGRRKGANMRGDALTEQYVRAAAAAARKAPEGYRRQAFVLGLAMALDKAGTLRRQPLTSGFARQVESDEELAARRRAIGTPTMRGRHDLLQHFIISAALAVEAGEGLAESIGVGKELADMQGASGFSFSDFCADLSGIAFARHLKSDEAQFASLAESFTVADYLPDLDGLKDGLSLDEFTAEFGSTSSAAYKTLRDEIVHRIEQLPPYRTTADAVWASSCLVLGGGAARLGELPPPADAEVDFAKDVQPLLKGRCYKCHGPKKQEGGLRLDQRDAALAGGDSGPAIEPGRSADSRLVQYVAGIDEDRVMPPAGQGERLTDEQVGLVRAWIDQGADWPDEDESCQ